MDNSILDIKLQEDFELAKIWQRSLAFVIDYFVFIVIFTLITVIFGEPNDDGGRSLKSLSGFLVFISVIL